MKCRDSTRAKEIVSAKDTQVTPFLGRQGAIRLRSEVKRLLHHTRVDRADRDFLTQTSFSTHDTRRVRIRN